MQLKQFPVEACKLRLSVLDLSNNSLSGLPPEIGMMLLMLSDIFPDFFREVKILLYLGDTLLLLHFFFPAFS